MNDASLEKSRSIFWSNSNQRLIGCASVSGTGSPLYEMSDGSLAKLWRENSFFGNKSTRAKDNLVRQAVWLNGEQRNEKDMLGVRNDCSSGVG